MSECMKFDTPNEYEEVEGKDEEEKKMKIEETVTYNSWYDWYYNLKVIEENLMRIQSIS